MIVISIVDQLAEILYVSFFFLIENRIEVKCEGIIIFANTVKLAGINILKAAHKIRKDITFGYVSNSGSRRAAVRRCYRFMNLNKFFFFFSLPIG